MRPHADLSPILNWIAPRSAHKGLLANKPWLASACREAVDLFDDRNLQMPAVVLASVHERAIDYIRQAPVLVLAVLQDADLALRDDRQRVTARFEVCCSAGPRLRDLMRFYGVAQQLKMISGKALQRDTYRLLAPLSAIPPSRLSQTIPTGVAAQKEWLDAVNCIRVMVPRLGREANWFIAWAAGNSCQNVDKEAVVDLIDFAIAKRSQFDQRWTFEQAFAASQRWHAEEAKRVSNGGMSDELLDEVIDYAPLPADVTLGDYSFVALQTRRHLIEEGRTMHHCVGRYSNRVVAGQCWIYSVQSGGKRVATLELAMAGGKFAIRQLKGACNSRVSKAISLAAFAFEEQVRGLASDAAALRQKTSVQGRVRDDLVPLARLPQPRRARRAPQTRARLQ